MANITLFHNPKCSKSRHAQEILDQAGVNYEVREYLKDPLTESEIKNIIESLGSEWSSIVRVKEDIFKKAPFEIKNPDVVAKKLSLIPKLLERPILVKGKSAVIGRLPEKIWALVKL